MVYLPTIDRAPIIRGSKVLVRADFDVPVSHGKVEEEFRIKEVLPTLRYVLQKGGQLRIIAHLGRPKGKRVRALSLLPVAKALERLIRRKIILIRDPGRDSHLKDLKDSPEIVLFENIRFFPGEEKNDLFFAKHLARWGDIYINEAFANSHRSHASMVALPHLLPSFAGFHLTEEVGALASVFKKKERRVFVVGGAKLETKLPLIVSFLKRKNMVLAGGAVGNTLLALQGVSVGKSKIDPSRQEFKNIVAARNLILPSDFIAAKEGATKGKRVLADNIQGSDIIYDIGPRTVSFFLKAIKNSDVLVWNGPLGLAEVTGFSHGTRMVARGVNTSSAFKVVGGGDTISILRKYNLLRGFDHVSTGGGAMLDFLAGKKMPALEVLRKSK